jgi:DNA modification methylase
MKPYYQDEQSTIYLGDCRDILPELPKVDLVLTDPPYGINYSTGFKGNAEWLGSEIANDGDTTLRDTVLDLLNGIPAVIFGSNKKQTPHNTKIVLIWDKGNALGMGDLSLPWKPSWEEIYILGSGFHGKRTSAVISYPPVQSMAKNGRLHPNEKPVQLIIELLQKCPAGLILDPFMGSGTTLIAAKKLGRKAIGIEISEKYCEIAVNRLRQTVMNFEIPKEKIIQGELKE